MIYWVTDKYGNESFELSRSDGGLEPFVEWSMFLFGTDGSDRGLKYGISHPTETERFVVQERHRTCPCALWPWEFGLVSTYLTQDAAEQRMEELKQRKRKPHQSNRPLFRVTALSNE